MTGAEELLNKFRKSGHLTLVIQVDNFASSDVEELIDKVNETAAVIEADFVEREPEDQPIRRRMTYDGPIA